MLCGYTRVFGRAVAGFLWVVLLGVRLFVVGGSRFVLAFLFLRLRNGDDDSGVLWEGVMRVYGLIDMGV